MTLVITGFSPAGYDLYGRRFLETFAAHWPADVRLVVYVEEFLRTDHEQVLISDIPEVRGFLDRHERSAKARGLKPQPCWKPKDHRNGYSFRTDAYKFGRTALFIRHAAETFGAEHLVWLDGDIVTHRTVPPRWIDGLIPEGADVAYLDRSPYHSEIGYIGFRLPGALPFIAAWSDQYIHDTFFGLNEWHSAFVFDHARKTTDGVRFANIADGRRPKAGHIWFCSPLGEYLDHLKGDHRKALGYSPERQSATA